MHFVRLNVPDVTYNANPGTGYAIYDSVGVNGYSGWFQVGGTSAATPQWAALIAITNSQRVGARKANLSATGTSVYAVGKSRLGTNFHAVTTGTNGSCGTMCDALTGYDYVTGLGTPQSKVLIPALAARNHSVCAFLASRLEFVGAARFSFTAHRLGKMFSRPKHRFFDYHADPEGRGFSL